MPPTKVSDPDLKAITIFLASTATPERGGRAKRYFKIEAPGLHALNQSREIVARLEGLVHAQ